MHFEPIAIVGQGCVLPGALDPTTLWDNISAGRVSVEQVSPEEWRMPEEWTGLGTVEWASPDRPPVAGLVRGFEEVFDPSGFGVDAEVVAGWDPALRWVLHAGRAALGDVAPPPGSGLVLGNLGYPWRQEAEFAEQTWFAELAKAARMIPGRPQVDPQARFSTGLPAQLAARALALGGGGFALDAACASSLYAIKIACDRLRDRSADLMVAGGVSGSDGLHIRQGFAAMQALSRSGRTRPFHRDADGLVPAEGAALVALMRYADAVSERRPILGVIRGIGLSNDGRAGGFFAPDRAGQERAMRSAYRMADVEPATVSLLECHATGTTVGDAVEIDSVSAVFADHEGLPLGSAKSNVGHLLTAAGAAGLLKVLGALNNGIRPASAGADEPTPELDDRPLRLLMENEPWTGPRRAAVSAFGFGGNNAHLIVDDARETVPAFSPSPDQETGQVAVVALGVRTGDGRTLPDFRAALLEGRPLSAPAATVETRLSGLRFPPNELAQALPQQILLLQAVRDAVAEVSLPPETTVLVGMGSDADAARMHARYRHESWAAAHGHDSPLAEGAVRPLTGGSGIGRMANVLANRISSQFDLTGPSFAVMAEEASGTTALDLADRALRAREVNAAVVGAVDVPDDLIHPTAARALGLDDRPGDCAVVLVLKRLADARQAGDPVLAVLDTAIPADSADVMVGPGATFDPADLFGPVHAARGLIAVAAAVLALRLRVEFHLGRAADPAPWARSARVGVNPLGGEPVSVHLSAGDREAAAAEGPLRVFVFSGSDAVAALTAMAEGRQSNSGPARLAVVAADAAQAQAMTAVARRWLVDGGPRPPSMSFRAEPVGGQVAFVYTNGSATYPGMGRALLLGMPTLLDRAEARHPGASVALAWAHQGDGRPELAIDQVSGALYLAVLHTFFTRDVLGVVPSASLGYSSGAGAALVALGVWSDIAGLSADVRASGVYTEELAGELRAVRTAWAAAGLAGERWSSYLVLAPPATVRAVIAAEPAVHVMAVNTPETCVIGGEERAVAATLAALGDIATVRLDYDLAAHAPELEGLRNRLRQLYRRPTTDVPGITFYNCVTGQPHPLDPESVAAAMADQIISHIDYVALVERAYADGVRVFIEHGPSALSTGWIKRILGDREHVAVALDANPGDGLRGLFAAAAELCAAGIDVDVEALAGSVTAPSGLEEPDDYLVVPAHAPRMRLAEAEPLTMSPAPALVAAPVTEPIAAMMIPAAADRLPRRRVAALAAVAQFRDAAWTQTEYLRTAAEAQRSFMARCAATAESFGVPTEWVPGSPASEPPNPETPVPALRPGPKFDRGQLEHLATGRISDLFGPQFSTQDDDFRQTRMPRPPLLLADRVTGIDAEPATMGIGRIWTETTVRQDSWYLDQTGRMPPGLLLEAGQADLLLISWLGADLGNHGHRVYRLLGCEAIFHGSPPAAGTELSYEIRINGHADYAGQRLFFFEYDGTANGEQWLTIRDGQAGFFSDEELAASAGVLWDPHVAPAPDGVVDAPAVATTARRFSAEQVTAFAQGRPADAFGPAWDNARTHVRSPAIGSSPSQLLREVTEFDPNGGPWGRGHLRVETPIAPEDWFFDGHFQNDPCMPGSLMFDGCVQAMSFYLAATGFTLDRDGWRFEPVPGEPCRLRCRSQVTPDSRSLVYEVFVWALSSGPYPTLRAEVLASVDGVKALHVEGLAVQLVPDFPLNQWRALGPAATQETGQAVAPRQLGGLAGWTESAPTAELGGRRLDYAALLACSWGDPAEGFGPLYAGFARGGRPPRVPGPPYHFMTRIVAASGPYGELHLGSEVVAEYDVPARAWFFAENATPVMPVSALMEVALQPCGWLGAYAGSPVHGAGELFIRNLDGDLAVHETIGPGAGTIRTTARLLAVSELNGMIIETFSVRCELDGRPLVEGTTVFGYFSPAALATQIGMPPGDGEPAAPARLGTPRDAGRGGLPGPMLLMIDRIAGHWPEGGRAGLGRVTAEKTVDAGEWFFKAHFFQDPVMPGSLGVEAIVQTVQWLMLEQGLADGLIDPCFDPVALDHRLAWKYRGQVVPADALISVEVEILETAATPDSRSVVAEAWLWVDGRRIYHLPRLAVVARSASSPHTSRS
ncbi:beta-ketoacyl synthase N-terminal-like domain-containing protein [Nocardia tengchongensis]|uniref:beta-ketoacyl synthase N-terminal-like domain-containing protein n=1 Tax=Nocardia tengchongensis TaxID=2055889 RepID=UPI003402BD2C